METKNLIQYNILYIEDERWQVEGGSDTVLKRRLNADVKLAVSITEARDLLHKVRYNVIIIDIMMHPNRTLLFEESGLVIAQELINGAFKPTNRKDTPILFATAVWDVTVTTTDKIRKPIRDVVNEIGIENPLYLLKPFTGDDLVSKVEEALQSGTSRTTNQ